ACHGREDLRWNNMGVEPPKAAEAPRDEDHDAFGEDVVDHPRAHPTGLTPVGSPVHDQQAAIAARFSEVDEADVDEIDEAAEVVELETEAEPAISPVLIRPVVAPVHAPMPRARRAPRARSVPGSKSKAAFTLRLDPNRHLKLRLACAVDGRSAPQRVNDALDQLPERMRDLDGLAEKEKRGGKTNEQAAS